MRTLGRPAHDEPRRGPAPAARAGPANTTASASSPGRYAPVVTAVAPLTLLGAVLYHPALDDLRNQDNVAVALRADTTRWGLSHLAVGLAAALVLLAFLEVDRFLRVGGGAGAGAFGVPFVVVGTVLFAFLPAMEIGMLAVHTAGGDVTTALRELNTWFQPILLAGAATFLVGLLLFARGVLRSPRVWAPLTWFVGPALVIAGLARFVPLGIALYLGAAALVVALGCLALAMTGRLPTSR